MRSKKIGNFGFKIEIINTGNNTIPIITGIDSVENKLIKKIPVIIAIDKQIIFINKFFVKIAFNILKCFQLVLRFFLYIP